MKVAEKRTNAELIADQREFNVLAKTALDAAVKLRQYLTTKKYVSGDTLALALVMREISPPSTDFLAAHLVNTVDMLQGHLEQTEVYLQFLADGNNPDDWDAYIRIKETEANKNGGSSNNGDKDKTQAGR